MSDSFGWHALKMFRTSQNPTVLLEHWLRLNQKKMFNYIETTSIERKKGFTFKFHYYKSTPIAYIYEHWHSNGHKQTTKLLN